MRTALVLCGVALALFAVSAGASVLLFSDLRMPRKTQEAKDKDKDKEPLGSDKESPTPSRGNSDTGSRPLYQRPGYNPETEQAVQLAARLREQEAQQNKRQRELAVQRTYLAMMQKDMREEREADEREHKETLKELDAATRLRAEVENKAKEIVDTKAETAKMITEAKKSLVEVDKNQNSHGRKVAGISDAMPAEAVADILIARATTGQSGGVDSAALLLARMKERNAAEVLTAVTAQEPDIARALLERMLLIRTSPPATPVTPASGTQP